MVVLVSVYLKSVGNVDLLDMMENKGFSVVFFLCNV